MKLKYLFWTNFLSKCVNFMEGYIDGIDMENWVNSLFTLIWKFQSVLNIACFFPIFYEFFRSDLEITQTRNFTVPKNSKLFSLSRLIYLNEYSYHISFSSFWDNFLERAWEWIRDKHSAYTLWWCKMLISSSRVEVKYSV